MDSPKTCRNFLECYPPDLWALIALYLSGEQIGRLKLTGATNLWRILQFPNVVKSVTLGRDDILFKCWPSFLNELPSIAELVIDDSDNSWVYFWPNLSCLPRTLRRLTILAAEERSSDFFCENGITSSLDDHAPFLEDLTVELDWSEDCPWVRKIPKNLTKLSILTWEAHTELPVTLLHLNADAIRYEDHLQLPTQLQTLSLQCSCENTDKFLASLPSSMRSLEVGFDDAEMFALDHRYSKLLPPSITKLGRVTFVEDHRLYATPETALLLPPHLRELLVCSMHLQYWTYLPETLKKLTIENVRLADSAAYNIASHYQTREVPRTNALPMDKLPKSLTDLNLTFSEPIFIDLDDDTVSTLFPPILTHLGLIRAQLSVSAAKQLPRSLRTLEISNIEFTVCEHLPRHLTALYAQYVILSPQLVAFLPKSLTLLNLEKSHTDDQASWYDPETGHLATIEELSLKYSEKIDFSRSCSKSGISAPKGYLNQAIDQRDDNAARSPGSQRHLSEQLRFWQGVVCLPSGLKTLVIYDNYAEIDNAFFSQQLAHLELLDLQFCTNLCDAAIPLLPPGLTTLNLKRASLITGKSFRYLPRSITDLNLAASTDIFDSDIQYLPRALRALRLKSAIHLTNGCVLFLPKLLLILKIQKNTKITPAVIDELPFRLNTNLAHHNFETALWRTDSGDAVAGKNLTFFTAFYWVVLGFIKRVTQYFGKRRQ